MSAPHFPHQNGTAERHWRTLFEMGRCLLLQANLGKGFWPYAVMAAAKIQWGAVGCTLSKKVPMVLKLSKQGMLLRVTVK